MSTVEVINFGCRLNMVIKQQAEADGVLSVRWQDNNHVLLGGAIVEEFWGKIEI